MFDRPTVDRQFFSATAEALSRLGIDLATLCHRHGMPFPLAGDEERIALSLISPVYDLIARETGDPQFIYRVARTTSPAGSGVLFQLACCCATVADSLRLFCRYSGVASDAVSYSLLTRPEGLEIVAVPHPHCYVSPHQVEVALYIPLVGYRLLAGDAGGTSMREAGFRHDPRFAVADYERQFGCPVRFGQPANILRLPRSTLERRLPGADAHLADYCRQVIERHEASRADDDSLTARVRRLYLPRLAFGEPDAATIAALLNMSTRTLQRRLVEEGTTWRALTDGVQQRVAERELQVPGRLPHEIALLTGFSDRRAFLRAFKRWTGMTPGQFRAARQIGAG